jgi:hypothetical protein
MLLYDKYIFFSRAQTSAFPVIKKKQKKTAASAAVFF